MVDTVQAQAAPDEVAMLLARCANADGIAFRRLFELQSSMLYSVGLRITRQPALAADAVHDAILQVWRNAARFDPARGTARAWLLSLVRYRALDSVARVGREVLGADVPEPADTDPDPLDRLLATREGQALHRCLEQVEPEQRGLVVLAFVEGLTFAEVAARVGQPLGSVKSGIRQALLTLRTGLAGWQVVGGAPLATGLPAHDLPDPDLDVAEYVMGLLAPEQARAIEALAMHDHAVSASITAWQARLSPLALTVKPEFPPPELWQRLALASGLQKIQVRRAARRRSLFEKIWGSLTLWRTTTLAALAVAGALAFLVLTTKPTPPEPLVAGLSPQGAPGVVFLVRIGDRSQATVSLVGRANIPLNRVLELWAVNEGATAPVSLGLMPNAGRLRLKAPVRAGTRLLVSQEPTGGSTTGVPTGPVVYTGLLAGG